MDALPRMRTFFDSRATINFAFRKEQLRRLKSALLLHEQEIYAALEQDLKKNPEESWVTELGFVIAEIGNTLKKLRSWMRPERRRTNLVNFPSASYILREPLGVVLIIAPWNYPLQLLFTPLVGAIAAGNCTVLKPSELAPATAAVMKKIIEETFSPQFVLCVEGTGEKIVPELINGFRFDHIFYTGSTAIGRHIYTMAAQQLVPVTLELGGKCPCVIEADAQLEVAARRIVVTKFSNAGQMCVAPDYLLVHRSVKERLVALFEKAIVQFFSANAEANYNYGRIVNEKQFNRLLGYLTQGKIVYGGQHNRADLFISPTLITDVDPDAPLMKDEIFGPILPILYFGTMEEAISIIQRNPDPLAFYIFTGNRQKEQAWIRAVPFGGGCINNASWHLTNHHLPFGGIRNSGIGAYHGRNSFELFSHRKAIMKTPTWFDPALKYPPLQGKLQLFKRIIK